MIERERPTPSTIAAAFPNNHLTTPESVAQPFSPTFSGDESRYPEDVPLVGSEIDEFSRGFNEIARYHQPHYEEREPEDNFETPDFEIPVFAPPHQPAGMNSGPLDLVPSNGASPTIGGLRRGGSGGSQRDRQRERDRLMGENKDDEEGSPNLSVSGRGFGSANVREQGWSPKDLRPSPPRSLEGNSRAGSGVQRYQLVDEVPTEGLQVLRTPGQLRATRPARGKNSG